MTYTNKSKKYFQRTKRINKNRHITAPNQKQGFTAPKKVLWYV